MSLHPLVRLIESLTRFFYLFLKKRIKGSYDIASDLSRTYGKGLKVYYDSRIIQSFPGTIVNTNDPLYKGVYGRLLERSDLINKSEFHSRCIRCYQYLIVWREQKRPHHTMDYAPIFIFEFEDGSKDILYDLGHYSIGYIELEKSWDAQLIVRRPWNAITAHKVLKGCAVHMETEIQILEEEQINEWWNMKDEKAQLRIREFLVYPFRMYREGKNTFFGRNRKLKDAIGHMVTPWFSQPLHWINSKLQKLVQNFGPESAWIIGIDRISKKYQSQRCEIFPHNLRLRHFYSIPPYFDENANLGEELLTLVSWENEIMNMERQMKSSCDSFAIDNGPFLEALCKTRNLMDSLIEYGLKYANDTSLDVIEGTGRKDVFLDLIRKEWQGAIANLKSYLYFQYGWIFDFLKQVKHDKQSSHSIESKEK